ncbi:hypothetical protein HKD37_U058631 [Glycine soja]
MKLDQGAKFQPSGLPRHKPRAKTDQGIGKTKQWLNQKQPTNLASAIICFFTLPQRSSPID